MVCRAARNNLCRKAPVEVKLKKSGYLIFGLVSSHSISSPSSKGHSQVPDQSLGAYGAFGSVCAPECGERPLTQTATHSFNTKYKAVHSLEA